MSRTRSNRARAHGFVIGLAIVVLFVTRFAAAAEPGPDPVLSLADDLWAQFELVYRSQPAEYERRQKQFNAVIAAWRAAPATATTDQLLSDWMRAAMRASMPGSRTPLPPTPRFVPTLDRKQPLAGFDLLSRQYAEPAETPESVVRPVATTSMNPFLDDPFLDDSAGTE